MATGTPRILKLNVDLSKCPANLAALIRREGQVQHAAAKIGVHKSTIGKWISGARPLPAKYSALTDAALATGAAAPRVGGNALPSSAQLDQPQAPQPVEPWDGETVATVRYNSVGGKIKTAKKVPIPLARLVEKFQGRSSDAAKAAGWKTGGAITQIFNGVTKYSPHIHERVVRALRGENPLAGQAADFAEDKFTLNIAIAVVTRNEYERLEDIAQVMGCPLAFRMGVGEGSYLVIYAQKDRDKLASFRKLASRDAKKFVCP